MAEYVTVADVDATLPLGWEGTADKDLSVMQSNAWLTARMIIAGDPIEANIILAGSLLAKLSADGGLYADSDPAIKRTKVKADTVESEKEFQDGARKISGQMMLIMDLLKPYFPSGGGSTFSVRRG